MTNSPARESTIDHPSEAGRRLVRPNLVWLAILSCALNGAVIRSSGQSSGPSVPPNPGREPQLKRTASADSDERSGKGGLPLTEAERIHENLFKENQYPSATICRNCHPSHYREWSVSAHAYAQMSPVFNAMHGTIVKQTSGSNGDFCIRCHTQVGMNLNEPIFMSSLDRHPTSREGITCVVCHRLENAYGKVSGRFALVRGDILEPVYGPTGNKELKRVLSLPEEYMVVTNRTQPGRKIHTDAKQSPQLTSSGFCGTCHDVTLMNGFRLEEAFSSFKNSPAAHRGESCQDCHMGTSPGKKSGYATAPAAIVGGEPTRPRKRTNHMFVGPDYSILHPGIFPHNVQASKMATLREWLTFDHRAGWGTEAFEKNVAQDAKFPARWTSAADRCAARAVLNDQFELLGEAQKQRIELLKTGYKLGDFVVKQANDHGLRFAIQVQNGIDGHTVPTGFDADRLVYLQVTVADSQGKIVFQSGDLDPNGDVRDLHSAYVRHRDLPLDKYLFTLQSRAITRNQRGGDREQVLPVNYSIDPLPYIRPEPFAVTFSGHPAGARVQRRGIEVLGERWANYKVDRSHLTDKGPYKIRVKFLAAMVPVNLINEIQVVGFDYNMSPREVADAIRNGHLLLYDHEIMVELDGRKLTVNLAEPSASPELNAKN